MSTDRRPSSLDGIKRLAKQISAESGKLHAEALNIAAKLGGFENFRHAQNNLAAPVTRPPARPAPATEREFPFLGRSEFHAKSLRRWITGVRQINPREATSVAWSNLARITEVLQPFLGQNHNHAHLPTGGGHDVLAVRPSAELGCLELKISEGLAYVVRPKRLTLELIPASPGESFLLLELAPLGRTGIYEPNEELPSDLRQKLLGSEELVELTPGDYLDRRHWDENEGPDGEPLPNEARLVVRWMGGQFLFVAKGSLWNGSARTYRGVHNDLTATQLRDAIERVTSRAA